MSEKPRKLTLVEWDGRYRELIGGGMKEPSYGGPLRRHADYDGDRRLFRLMFDNSEAALRLWNFLLTEECRLHEAREKGNLIVGAMKDLGTVPVMAYSLPNVTAFYPDGAWWTPCIMENTDGLLRIADSLGIDESFCPVRALLGAFVNKKHFPLPDMLVCSVGAVCDDLSAIAQRLEWMGHPVVWWEMTARRRPDPGEDSVVLPGGFEAPRSQVEFVKAELERVKSAIEKCAGKKLDDGLLSQGIKAANTVRGLLRELRREVYTAEIQPLPALEMLIAEMLALHYCSDRDETIAVCRHLLDEVRRRKAEREGYLDGGSASVFWVNPVADLKVMNLLEDCGGRICGTDYMFAHALDGIPEDVPPMEALAMTALADPMVGSVSDRALRICRDISDYGAEAVIVSRIPGASHCATEGGLIHDIILSVTGLPVIEIEVPSIADSMIPTLRTRIEAVVERVLERRR